MRINSIISVKFEAVKNYSNNKKRLSEPDNFSKQNPFIVDNNYIYYEKGNLKGLVSFLGAAKIVPAVVEQSVPKIKMKVAAVSKFQDAISEITQEDIKKHNKLDFVIEEEKKHVKLIFKKTGKSIGYVYEEVLHHLYEDIKKTPENFKFELTHLFEKRKDTNNIGLIARVNYVGAEKKKMNSVFDELIEDLNCQGFTFESNAMKSPEDNIKKVLKYDELLHGSQAKLQTETTLNSIKNEILSPKNKNILVFGHDGPDGDCVGSVLLWENGIKLADSSKNVDCCLADRSPQLFNFLKDIKKIKFANKSEVLKNIKKQITELKKDPTKQEEVELFEKIAQNIKTNYKPLPRNKIYDLVIITDTSTPERLGYDYSKHIGPNTKVIFVDHHQKRFGEWIKAKDKTKIDLEKSIEQNLVWVEDRVPAAAQLVAGILGRLNPKLNSEKAYNLYSKNGQKRVENIAAAFLTGLQTDTSNFSRSANFVKEDAQLPAFLRPKYDPIGIAKWFSKITDHKITRNYIQKSLTKQEKKVKELKKFVQATLPDKSRRDDVLQVNYAQLEPDYTKQLWKLAVIEDPTVTFKDILGAVKYSKAFRRLKKIVVDKANPEAMNDPIAYVATQSAKKGEMDYNYRIAKNDSITFSFRSKKATEHAAIIGTLFNGGGHGAAAGGRIALENINFNTKLLVLVDNKIEKDSNVILKALMKNLDLESSAIPEAEKNKLRTDVKVIQSPIAEEGQNVHELIASVVKEIRNSSQDLSQKELLNV